MPYCSANQMLEYFALVSSGGTASPSAAAGQAVDQSAGLGDEVLVSSVPCALQRHFTVPWACLIAIALLVWKAAVVVVSQGTCAVGTCVLPGGFVSVQCRLIEHL